MLDPVFWFVISGEPILRACRLTRRYPRIEALHEVDFSVSAGRTSAVVGSSGSGKSTLARCLALHEIPTSGEIWRRDQNLTALGAQALRSIRPRIQLVFQEPGRSLNPHWSAARIVSEPAAIAKPGTSDARPAREWLEMAGLPWTVADRVPGELSGGQRARLALARALAAGPEILILDEFFGSLDLAIQARLLDLLRELKDRALAALVVITHDLGLARAVADDIAVFHQGRVVEHGPAGTVLGHPVHAETMRLRAASPAFPAPAA